MRATLLLGLGLAACVEFDADVDRFACETDEDCGSDYVCGGFALVDGRAKTFCVAAAAATVAIDVAVPSALFACATPPAGTALESRTEVAVLASSDATAADSDFGEPVACDVADAAASGGGTPCCVGDPSPFNGDAGHLLCIAPAAGTAKLAVRRTYTSGTALLLRLDAVGAVPGEGLKLVEVSAPIIDDDVTELNVRDYMMSPALTRPANTNRCGGRAVARQRFCETPSPTSTAAEVCGCVPSSDPQTPSTDPCPAGFFCTAPVDGTTPPTCWPRGSLATGEACTDDDGTPPLYPDTGLACSSNVCIGTTCR